MKHYFVDVNVVGDDDYDENYRFIIEANNKKEAKEDAIIDAAVKFALDGGENPTCKIEQCYQTTAEASVD